jgi:hypothetical protein
MYILGISVVVVSLLFAQAGFKTASVADAKYRNVVNSYNATIDSLKRQNSLLSITGSQLQLDLIACRDSIAVLKVSSGKKMSTATFKKLYKFDQLWDRYKDIKKNPSQGKYLRGWFFRIMEADL